MTKGTDGVDEFLKDVRCNLASGDRKSAAWFKITERGSIERYRNRRKVGGWWHNKQPAVQRRWEGGVRDHNAKNILIAWLPT